MVPLKAVKHIHDGLVRNRCNQLNLFLSLLWVVKMQLAVSQHYHIQDIGLLQPVKGRAMSLLASEIALLTMF